MTDPKPDTSSSAATGSAFGDLSFVPLPDEVRGLLDDANYVHLSTIRADGTPRNWVVWVGLEGDRILVCTGESTLKARDMARNPAVALSVTALSNPYAMAAVQGRVVEIRDDADGRWMDAISHKYTGQPFPMRGPGRRCYVIAAVKAGACTLAFEHSPGG
jgi:PPOX class probable F420-dependent enzyme